MFARLRGRLPRHSTVAAYASLFIALGGVSYAAVNLPNNSVTSADIKKNAVKQPETAKNSVASREVKNRSLRCADFAKNVPACAPDAVGMSNTTVRSHTETIEMTCEETPSGPGFRLNCTGTEIARAPCNPGERATGGGYLGPTSFQEGNRKSSGTVQDDRPDPTSGTPNGWAVRVTAVGENLGSAGLTAPPNPQVTVYVVCAS
jgi:hypothetical protein